MGLAEAFASSRFLARDVWEHARLVDPALLGSLEDACLDNEQELGHWLARMAGIDVAGFVLIRGRRARGGGRWWSLRSVADVPDVPKPSHGLCRR